MKNLYILLLMSGLCVPTMAQERFELGKPNDNNYRKHVYAGFVRGLNGGEPSGIAEIEDDRTIDFSKGIYSIQGMHLPATSLDNLPCGTYIVGGKKVVIK